MAHRRPDQRAAGPAGRSLSACGPQLILYNAEILTVNPGQPRARAVAVLDDRILAVGDQARVRALASVGTRQIDLEGRAVLPGFVDAHCHLNYAGLMHLHWVDCALASIGAIQAALSSRANQTATGEWVRGFKYDDGKTAERRFLGRADLDVAAPRHPVFVLHRGGHSAHVNSLALERLGISESTDDPPGGRLEREPSTLRLTGRLCESAIEPFLAAMPSTYSRAENQAATKLITGMMSRAGITSAHDMWTTPDDLRAYQDAHQAGELSLRVYCMVPYPYWDRMQEAGLGAGFGDPWVRVGGLKLVCDGSISERTALLSAPYVGRPHDCGIEVMGEEELFAHAVKAHRDNWQIGIHANGDVAIDTALRVHERLQREYRRPDPRFRVEHCTVLNEALLRRIRALNAIPTPFAAYVYYHGEKMAEYGPDRLESMFALRSLLDAGVMVAPGSDYPPGPFEPMMALQSGVTRTDLSGRVWGASQKISVEEAIRIGTLHGAYASFEEGLKGSLEPGKLADLVVLGADPTKVEPSSLVQVPVCGTMVGGRWVYEA